MILCFFRVELALLVGMVCGFGAILMNVYLWIPSFVSSVFMFRRGVIPSLGNSEFELYREATDQATQLIGIAFWGQAFTCFFSFTIPFIVTLFIFWNEMSKGIKILLANLVAVFATMLICVIVMINIRQETNAGFYRKKWLAASNIISLAVECWNIALSSGIMFVRSVVLFALGAAYIGRIDTPFLYPGVDRVGKVWLDRAPAFYRKDLLQHEAH